MVRYFLQVVLLLILIGCHQAPPPAASDSPEQTRMQAELDQHTKMISRLDTELSEQGRTIEALREELKALRDGPKWGTIEPREEPGLDAFRILTVTQDPPQGDLYLPTPFPNIVRAWTNTEDGEIALSWSVGATPAIHHTEASRSIHLLTASDSRVHDNGIIVLSAFDAEPVGTSIKLEADPGNYRVGFWTNPEDYPRWDLNTGNRAGSYNVELVYSRMLAKDAEAVAHIDDTEVPVVLKTTKHS